MATSPNDLSKQLNRMQPQQSRSKKRVEQIRKAAADVLVECGYDGTTLKQVAERADIKQTSIYRYWPNKQAIVRDLVSDFTDGQDGFLETARQHLDEGTAWREVLAGYIANLRLTVEQNLWISPCHNAMISDPELKDLDRKTQDHFTDQFTGMMEATGLVDDEAQRGRIGRMMTVLLDSFVLSLNRHIEPSHEVIEREMAAIIERYISNNVAG